MKDFFTEVYPHNWKLAYDAGVEARKQGFSRICNLRESIFYTPSGKILKVYLSAWEQGWDGYKIPEIFKQMETVINSMPLN